MMLRKKPNMQNRKVPATLIRIVGGTLLMISAMCMSASAQSITIPSGGTLDVNNGTLTVPGGITNNGNLLVDTGSINLTGSWDNNSTFTAGTSTVTFNGTGAQTLDSGGTGAGNFFYNVIHSGSGTTTLGTNSIDINNDFSNTAGTFGLSSFTMNLAGDFTQSAGVTFAPGTGTLNLDGSAQTVSADGTANFYNFNKNATTSDTITFATGVTGPVISNSLSMTATAGDFLTITSNNPPTQAPITLSVGSSQVLDNLLVGYSDASGGLLLVGGSDSAESPAASTTNWSFGSVVITWEGDNSSDIQLGANWDVGIVPGDSDTAIIPDVTGGGNVQPIATANVRVEDLIISADATLTMDGFNLTVDDTLSNSGTIRLDGDESTVSIGTFDTDSGTIEYIGTGAVANLTIHPIASFYNLTINDATGNGTFITSQNLSVLNNLTVTDGILDISTSGNTATITSDLTVAGGTLLATNGNVDVNGNVILSSGTITAPTSGQSFNVTGNWTNSGGTLNANAGAVLFDTVGTSVITGDTTFYNFGSETPAKVFTFTAGSTTSVSNALQFTTTSGNEIVLQSSSGGSDWFLSASSVQTVSNLNVSDSDAILQNINCVNCIDNGGNDNADAQPHWIFVHPLTGVVFESSDNLPVELASISLLKSDDTAAVVGVDLADGDTNPIVTGSDGVYTFRPITATDYRINITATGFDYPTTSTNLPVDRSIITGSKGERFDVVSSSIVMDQPVDFNGGLIRIEKDANKKEVKVGDIVTYTISMENISSDAVPGVYLKDKIPPGFQYLDDRVILDGVPIANPTGRRPIVFNVGDFTVGQVKSLQYQLVVGTGVEQGDYKNSAIAEFSNGLRISNTATEAVKVVLDPLFDLGNIIGKVFWDKNENGVQDAPYYDERSMETIVEVPIPSVKIVMEDGTVVTSDREGRFNFPSVLPGRHLYRIDERTLPKGSYLTTDKVVVHNVTRGVLAKINFGVNIDETRFLHSDDMFFVDSFNLEQKQEKPVPRLHVGFFDNEVVMYQDEVLNSVEFRIFTNYAAFIEHWKFEIIDADTELVIKSIEGDRYNIFNPILWNGKDGRDRDIRLDRNYKYRLKVQDARGNFDETLEKELRVREIEEQTELDDYEEYKTSSRSKYSRWVADQQKLDSLQKQNILVDGETIILDQLDTRLQSIRIDRDGELHLDLPIVEKYGLTAKELLDRGFSENDPDQVYDVILPKGDYEIIIQEKEGDGVVASDTVVQGQVEGKSNLKASLKTYKKNVKVGEDYMFFLALGDGKVGYTINTGNIEPVESNSEYKEGFYAEGKLAYYLKGKVLGKYLVTSSFDSERESKELFRNLNPEEYYPVYGDDSSIDYQATETQGRLYLLVEWDKSSLTWGNYSIGFDDTEFAQFIRSFYGGKIDYESLSTTKYGDARSKVVAFRARSQQQSAHNEFLATGGSLYFTKHKDVLDASEKVVVEVRDNITGLVLSKREMVEGADYEFDYDSGRILFWRPVPILVESYSIISSQLLEGNPVYVVVDYEYEVVDKIDEANIGLRTKQAITDEVLLGTTFVRENQQQQDYELFGTDVTFRIGPDANIIVEYAETKSDVQGSFVSTDGGLSFTELVTDDGAKGKAYGIKGDARLFNRLGLTGSYKYVDSTFSTSSTDSQQGKELIGLGGVYDFSDNTRVTVRHDIQNIIDDGNAQTQFQVGAQRTATTQIQIVHEARRLTLTGEYRRTEVTEKIEKFDSETNSESDLLAVRADYELTQKVDVSLEQQVTLTGDDVNTTTIGIEARPTEKVSLRAEEVISKDGTATKLGVTADMNESLSLTGEYAIASTKDGALTETSSVGATSKLEDGSTLRAALGLSESNDIGKTSTYSIGGTSKVDDNTETSGDVTFSDTSSTGDQAATYTFGTKSRINEQFDIATSRSFGNQGSADIKADSYALGRTVDGKRLEGKLTQQYSESNVESSESNIFGLTGDINDKWAVTGAYERGDVQNIDGTDTKRDVISLAGSYVKKDEETGEQDLKSSTKLEVRFDEGESDKRQYLIFNAIEGEVTPEVELYSQVQFSKTRNVTGGFTENQFKEMIIGGAYRPIYNDRLNILARYTYLEEKSPSSQSDTASVEEESAHVVSTEAIYDLNERWQISEKFAYRLGEEKVTGFDFTKTHTWLMIHRLDYKINKDWLIGGEFRVMTQEEAQDTKRGVLIEAARSMGEFAQLGLGWNFTDFDDKLTDLDYKAYGPFVRLTGKLYDRTSEEIERARQEWLNLKIDRWSWIIVQEELKRFNSPILRELNDYFLMAKAAQAKGDLKEARALYRDIIQSGKMMLEEASEHIRGQISKEEKLKELSQQADEFIKTKQYDEARKILEKIVVEAQKDM